MAKKAPPKSPFKRSLSLFGAAAQIASKELSSKVKTVIKNTVEEKASETVKLRIEQAKIISENLGQLKGAAMKVGQLLSTEAKDFLPQEALDILAKLQSNAPKVSFEVMHEQIINDLGSEKLNSLKNFNENPIAAASIGQVYEAELPDGREVVLKVQYPGVADSIYSDIKILKRLVEPMLKVSGRQIDLDDIFEEIAKTLSLEADYENEKKSTMKYRENVLSYGEFLTPEVIPEYCGKKVLCMTKIEGMSLFEWIKSEPSYEDRLKIGQSILDLFMLEFFEFGFVQTDPNFGNYLVQPDPLRLVLLDFGSTKQYTKKFIKNYRKLLSVLVEEDPEVVLRAAYDFDLLDERESEKAQERLIEMLKASFEPFQPHVQPFKFDDQDYAKRSREVVLNFISCLKYTPPRKDLIFLHRKLGGIFNLLKNLGVELNLTPYWEKMT